MDYNPTDNYSQKPESRYETWQKNKIQQRTLGLGEGRPSGSSRNFLGTALSRGTRVSKSSGERAYNIILRLSCVLSAIWLWYYSNIFSIKGFSFDIGNFGAAIVLSVVCTIMELIFNKDEEKSRLLEYAGLICYVYGIGTNILGIHTSQLATNRDSATAWVVASVSGAIMDMLPEPLLLYGLFGVNGVRLSNFFGNIKRLFTPSRSAPGQIRHYSNNPIRAGQRHVSDNHPTHYE